MRIYFLVKKVTVHLIVRFLMSSSGVIMLFSYLTIKFRLTGCVDRSSFYTNINPLQRPLQ